MAYAILECIEPSQFFTKTALKLDEGVPQDLGRSLKDDVSSINGLLEAKCLEICFQHAFLVYANNKFFLEDTSLNGTFLNGHRILTNIKYNIISGDIIQLGGESFSVTGNLPLITLSVKLFAPEDTSFINMVFLKNINEVPFQLYKEIPNFECSLSLLYHSVINRFEALKILDTLGNTNCMNEKLFDWILNQFREKDLYDMVKLVLGTSCSYEEEYHLQKMDHISHFILRVASCRNYVMKKWFLDQEKKLLLLRWKYLTRYEKCKIVSEQFSFFEEVNEFEKKKVAETSNGLVEPSLKYYKVFFTEASELIAKRVVYIKSGSCYVHLDDFIHVIATDFTKHLNINLEKIKKSLHKIWNDERIISIISCVEKEVQFEKFLFGRCNTTVMLKEIDTLAEESFPLCMNQLHFNLKQNNHLKNGGRFQYGLFLKGMGLSLQDSLVFWRHYLTKKMSIHEFMRHYNYHVFHIYGAIGKRANYPPQSCKKIFQVIPSYSEYHGCPFKLFDEENITSLLQKHDLNVEEINCIIEIMKNGTPQIACSKYFEIKHGTQLRETVFHPNIYYEESRKLHKATIEPQPRVSSVKRVAQDRSRGDCCSANENAKMQNCSSFYEW